MSKKTENKPDQLRPPVLDRRRGGILLHPTSLPGGLVNGDLGPDAYRFVDFLSSCGISVWQTLPLGPTHGDKSPYQCLSVHAGNPLLISLDLLVKDGWLSNVTLQSSDDPVAFHKSRLVEANKGFKQSASEHDHKTYATFVTEHKQWLEDYALFQALRQSFNQQHWLNWPIECRNRQESALNEAQARLGDAIEQVKFEQYVFFRQWTNLKRYAHECNVLLFGDLPIFVAHDSAEVWADREQFEVNDQGEMIVVAGVPPDYFSATGQLWGNPHYNWERMKGDGFQWWQQRLRTQLDLFDLIRVDHFRGFEAYWEVPADAETAINGRWVKAPGDKLFSILHNLFSPLPLVAEDLGVITPEVVALRQKHGFPGMKILQFAFDSDAKNPYLPHNHETECVVYTGTHDNNTTLGWFQSLPPQAQHYVLEYLGYPNEPMPWPLIKSAFASVANLAVVPMQDILMLDGEHRMNTPGVTENNWRWRFKWDQIEHGLAARVQRLIQIYGRSVIEEG